MAHLQTKKTRHNPDERLKWKLQLVKMLYQRGYSKKDILELFRFIDWMMTLPPALERKFEETLVT